MGPNNVHKVTHILGAPNILRYSYVYCINNIIYTIKIQEPIANLDWLYIYWLAGQSWKPSVTHQLLGRDDENIRLVYALHSESHLMPHVSKISDIQADLERWSSLTRIF